MCEACGGSRWVTDPDYAPGNYQPPPAPHVGLMPCPECGVDGWDAPWPPQPAPVVRPPAMEQLVAQQADWVDLTDLPGG
jgi:hypothetical protein